MVRPAVHSFPDQSFPSFFVPIACISPRSLLTASYLFPLTSLHRFSAQFMVRPAVHSFPDQSSPLFFWFQLPVSHPARFFALIPHPVHSAVVIYTRADWWTACTGNDAAFDDNSARALLEWAANQSPKRGLLPVGCFFLIIQPHRPEPW